jgi:cytochrome b561
VHELILVTTFNNDKTDSQEDGCRFANRSISRAKAYNVQRLPGNAQWENSLGSLGHFLLYGFMTIMPASGIAMGYYGGKGLPFFYKTIPGAEIPNGKIAKQSFSIHKTLGTYGKYLVPLHAGAGVMHAARGQKIFARINPFRTPRG